MSVSRFAPRAGLVTLRQTFVRLALPEAPPLLPRLERLGRVCSGNCRRLLGNEPVAVAICARRTHPASGLVGRALSILSDCR
jgi:hypothetical protein